MTPLRAPMIKAMQIHGFSLPPGFFWNPKPKERQLSRQMGWRISEGIAACCATSRARVPKTGWCRSGCV